jgi:hydrogenase/urease accessory protein HupE
MNCNTDTKGQFGRCTLLATVLLFVCPATAYAHLVSTGFGPFYDGIIHLALSPDDLLAVIAIALLSGLLGARNGRAVLFILPSAWLIGGFFGLKIGGEVFFPIVNTLSFLMVGVLVSADRKLPLWLVAGIALVLGLLHGVFNGSAMVQAGGGLLSLVGITTAVFVLVAIVAAFVVSLRAVWTRVAVRVAGSWITAIGFLMLGWEFRR